MEATKKFTPEDALQDAKELEDFGGALSEDYTPAQATDTTLISPEGRRETPMSESETWKELQEMQGQTPKLKRKRAGGLPTSPEPIKTWAPSETATETVEEVTTQKITGPTTDGPSSGDAFRAQKMHEEGEEPMEDIDPLEYIQANFEGAPTKAQIDNWTASYGDVFITGLTDDEVFIWRTVKRLEYKNIMQQVAQAAQALAANPAGQQNVEDGRNALFIEKVCEKCILWPEVDVDQLTFSKAGTLDTLANLVLEASNFVPHSLALRLTRKL